MGAVATASVAQIGIFNQVVDGVEIALRQAGIGTGGHGPHLADDVVQDTLGNASRGELGAPPFRQTVDRFVPLRWCETGLGDRTIGLDQGHAFFVLRLGDLAMIVIPWHEQRRRQHDDRAEQSADVELQVASHERNAPGCRQSSLPQYILTVRLEPSKRSTARSRVGFAPFN